MQNTKTSLNVLLTEGSSLSARQALYTLNRHHKIDVLDPDPICQGRFSRFVRRVYRCPPFSVRPEEYLSCLAERLHAGSYDVLLPTHDQVYLLARFAPELQRHVGLALPSFEALERMQSKADFARLLAELNLPQPRFRIVHSRRELEAIDEFPCWIKLAYSTAGGGVHQVADRNQLHEVAQRFEAAGLLDGHAEIVVQQPAQGTQSTVQAVFQHGTLVAAHSFEARAIGVGGSAMARVSAFHPKVIEHVRRLGAHLDWHGAMFIDYFFDPRTGQPQFIEANPRIGETVNAWLSGVNLCEALLRVSLDEPVKPAIGTGRVGVRTHSGFMITMAQAMQGASRRRLIRELWSFWRGCGRYQESTDDLTRPCEDWYSVLPAIYLSLQLVAWPAAAHRIVRNTVNNYSLHDAAVETIRRLPIDQALRCVPMPAKLQTG